MDYDPFRPVTSLALGLVHVDALRIQCAVGHFDVHIINFGFIESFIAHRRCAGVMDFPGIHIASQKDDFRNRIILFLAQV